MPFDIAQAAAALGRARLAQRRIDLKSALRPANAADAYAVQDGIGRLLGRPVRAWKVGAADAHAEPSAAPIYDLWTSPARIAPATAALIGVEAELAVVFGTALPAREATYGDAEVRAAVREACVAIEVCASRMENWQAADDLSKLADHGLNFALVLGDRTYNFASLDYRSLEVRTLVNATVIKQGRGTHAVDNPLALLTWLANHARSRGGIAPGMAVTTGAWLGLHPIQPGDEVAVEFPAIGRASVAWPMG